MGVRVGVWQELPLLAGSGHSQIGSNPLFKVTPFACLLSRLLGSLEIRTPELRHLVAFLQQGRLFGVACVVSVNKGLEAGVAGLKVALA